MLADGARAWTTQVTWVAHSQRLLARLVQRALLGLGLAKARHQQTAPHAALLRLKHLVHEPGTPHTAVEKAAHKAVHVAVHDACLGRAALPQTPRSRTGPPTEGSTQRSTQISAERRT